MCDCSQRNLHDMWCDVSWLLLVLAACMCVHARERVLLQIIVWNWENTRFESLCICYSILNISLSQHKHGCEGKRERERETEMFTTNLDLFTGKYCLLMVCYRQTARSTKLLAHSRCVCSLSLHYMRFRVEVNTWNAFAIFPLCIDRGDVAMHKQAKNSTTT